MNVPPTVEAGQAKTADAAVSPLARIFAILLVAIGLVGLADLAFVLIGRSPADGHASFAFAFSADLALLVLFGLQHSGMARDAWKKRFSPRWNRAVYVAASGAACMILAHGWQPLPGEAWWAIPRSQITDVATFLVLGLAGLGLAICFLRMDLLEFVGLRPFWPRAEVSEVSLDTAGPYRFVRHPLMLFTLVFLWVRPVMEPTQGWLVLGLTAYTLLGTILEERDLVRRFSAAYLEYRRRTPMFVPWRWPRAAHGSSPLNPLVETRN